MLHDSATATRRIRRRPASALALLAATTLVVVAAVVVKLRAPTPDGLGVEAAPRLDAEPRQASEGARALPREPQRAAPRLEPPRAPPPEAPLDLTEPSSAPAVSISQLVADVQVSSPPVAGHIAEAERDMVAQGKDPLRSAAMETHILDEIAQKSLGLEMIDLAVDCRITLCRVQFVLPKTFLQKKFGDVPRDAIWTGREPVSFFIEALDLDWRYTTAFGGLDRYGSPVVLGYVAMPLPTPRP